MIKDAFLELMDTIGFSKITVKNLTKKASISRNTFYLHYKDKFDLLEQLENEILDGLKSLAMDLPIEVQITEGSADDKMFAVILQALEYIQKNRYFFSLIIGKNGDPAFYRKLHETIKSVMLSKNLMDKLKIPEKYAIAFVIGGHTSIINEWLSSGMKETPYELASIITSIFKNMSHSFFDPKT